MVNKKGTKMQYELCRYTKTNGLRCKSPASTRPSTATSTPASTSATPPS